MQLPSMGQDRPIEHGNEDLLARGPFVDNLIRALVEDATDLSGHIASRRSTGIVVGLTGKWGAGKSSIINLVADRLAAMEHVAVATLNPWLFKGREELLSAFFNELREALGRSPGEKTKDVLKALDGYRDTIGAAADAVSVVADAAGGGGALSIGKKVLFFGLKAIKRPEELSAQVERRALERKLAQANLAVVVLIDELDRIEDDDVRAVAQLVKAVGDIKGISYLVAYDPKRVAEALGRGSEEQGRRASGAAYLEKIVQHPIPIRPLFSEDIEALLAPLLEHHGLSFGADLSENEQQIIDCVRKQITTPRELKRLIGAYAVLDRMVRQEISGADLLAYSWLLTKAPQLRDTIANDLDAVVDDPGADEWVKRIDNDADQGKADAAKALGPEAEPHAELLRLMFPRFGLSRTSGGPGNRLSRRRNLVRLLYLGDPPGIVTRATIEDLWGRGNVDDLAAELSLLIAEGKLRAVVDRLDDLLPWLSPTGDRTFWPALSRSLMRSSDWQKVPDDRGDIADDASAYLLRLAIRNRKEKRRVQETLEVLCADGDLIVTPWILRKHLFNWGMVPDQSSSSPSGDALLDREETQALLARVLPVYREALLQGLLLRRVPNVEAMFVIKNSGAWDAELRASLTQQLQDPDARATFAALVVPPGYGADRGALDEMFDAEAILSVMDTVGEGRRGTEWIAICLRRLRLALEGKSTIFSADEEEE